MYVHTHIYIYWFIYTYSIILSCAYIYIYIYCIYIYIYREREDLRNVVLPPFLCGVGGFMAQGSCEEAVPFARCRLIRTGLGTWLVHQGYLEVHG